MGGSSGQSSETNSTEAGEQRQGDRYADSGEGCPINQHIPATAHKHETDTPHEETDQAPTKLEDSLTKLALFSALCGIVGSCRKTLVFQGQGLDPSCPHRS